MEEQKLKQLKAAFRQFDKNNDGLINKQELMSILKKVGRQPSEQEISDIIHNLDHNDKGAINFQEFINLITSGGKPQDKMTEMREQFRQFDLNGDGYVSKDELFTLLQ